MVIAVFLLRDENTNILGSTLVGARHAADLDSVETGVNTRLPSDTLSRYERVEDLRSVRSFVRRAQWPFSRGVAKSINARTLGTESRPCGETRCTGSGGSSSFASTISSSPRRTCSAT